MQVNKYYYISIKNISMKNVNISKGKKDVDREKKLSTCINKNALVLQRINDSYKSVRKGKQKYRITKESYMKGNSNGNKHTYAHFNIINTQNSAH